MLIKNEKVLESCIENFTISNNSYFWCFFFNFLLTQLYTNAEIYGYSISVNLSSIVPIACSSWFQIFTNVMRHKKRKHHLKKNKNWFLNKNQSYIFKVLIGAKSLLCYLVTLLTLQHQKIHKHIYPINS